jgi:hypothetical protein
MWELIKNDGLTVREARTSKKGAPTPQQRKQPVEQALKAGWGFVQRLRKANNKGTSLTHNVKDELQKLRDEIDVLLGQLNEK